MIMLISDNSLVISITLCTQREGERERESGSRALCSTNFYAPGLQAHQLSPLFMSMAPYYILATNWDFKTSYWLFSGLTVCRRSRFLPHILAVVQCRFQWVSVWIHVAGWRDGGRKKSCSPFSFTCGAGRGGCNSVRNASLVLQIGSLYQETAAAREKGPGWECPSWPAELEQT